MKTTFAMALALFALGCCVGHVAGCASFPSTPKELEAETAYGAHQYHECVAPEPILGPRAPREERLAAWERVDACRAKVRKHWGIVETMTDAGGDR